MARSTLIETDQHVVWLAEWRELLERIRELAETGNGPGEVQDELLELEDSITTTPPTTRAGMLAIIEVAQHQISCDPDTPARQALKALAAGIAAGI
jgi:hypothetical protein